MDLLEEKKPKKAIHSPFVKRIQSLKISKEEAQTAADDEPKGLRKPLGLWTVSRREKKPTPRPKAMITLTYEKGRADSDALHDLLEKEIVARQIRKKPAKLAKWKRKQTRAGAPKKKAKPAKKTRQNKKQKREKPHKLILSSKHL